MSEKKSLDIESFIALFKTRLQNTNITKTSGSPFYGKVTFCIHDGKMTHVEKNEIIK